ncbi:MAG: hypothetical protein CMM93_08930 [Rickettsiales bacterium]|nr:hypothetical protein [Rickettsiales bacterium]|tara:strand:+ start:2199 stop:5303 length:3105 start_codon:yes stop_codon:yes gene_type:complete
MALTRQQVEDRIYEMLMEDGALMFQSSTAERITLLQKSSRILDELTPSSVGMFGAFVDGLADPIRVTTEAADLALNGTQQADNPNERRELTERQQAWVQYWDRNDASFQEAVGMRNENGRLVIDNDKIRRIAKEASDAWEAEQNPSGWQQFLSAVVTFFTTFDVQKAMSEFSSSSSIVQGAAEVQNILSANGINAETAERITQLNDNGVLNKDQLPSYYSEADITGSQRVDINDYYSAHEDVYDKSFSHSAAYYTGVGITTAAGGTVAYRIGWPAAKLAAGTTKASIAAIGNVASGAMDAVTNPVQNIRLARMDVRARATLDSDLALKVDALRAERVAAKEALHELPRAAKIFRAVGKTSVYAAGAVPLIGGGVAAAESMYYADLVMEAEDLNADERNLILGALSAHAALGFGGFISEGLDQGLLEAIHSNPKLEQYVPRSLRQDVLAIATAFRGNAADSVLHARMEAMRAAGQSLYEYRDYMQKLEPPQTEMAVNQKDFVDLIPGVMRGIAQGRIDASHPHYQMMLEMMQMPVEVNEGFLGFGGSTEKPAVDTFFHAALAPQGQTVEEKLADLGRISKDLAPGFKSGFNRNLRQMAEAYYQKHDAEATAYASAVTAKELYNDLLQQGPIYQRLLNHVVNQETPISLERFHSQVAATLEVIEKDYLRGPVSRPDEIFRDPNSLNASHYGGLLEASRGLYQRATQAEWQAYVTQRDHAVKMAEAINESTGVLLDRHAQLQVAYFQHDPAASASKELSQEDKRNLEYMTYNELLTVLQHNEAVKDWFAQNPDADLHVAQTYVQTRVAQGSGNEIAEFNDLENAINKLFDFLQSPKGQAELQKHQDADFKPVAEDFAVLDVFQQYNMQAETAIALLYALPDTGAQTPAQQKAILDKAAQLRDKADHLFLDGNNNTPQNGLLGEAKHAFFKELGEFVKDAQYMISKQNELQRPLQEAAVLGTSNEQFASLDHDALAGLNLAAVQVTRSARGGVPFSNASISGSLPGVTGGDEHSGRVTPQLTRTAAVNTGIEELLQRS